VESDPKMAAKYPGSTGNGDGKNVLSIADNVSQPDKVYGESRMNSLVPYPGPNSSLGSVIDQELPSEAQLATKKQMANLRQIFKFYSQQH